MCVCRKMQRFWMEGGNFPEHPPVTYVPNRGNYPKTLYTSPNLVSKPTSIQPGWVGTILFGRPFLFLRNGLTTCFWMGTLDVLAVSMCIWIVLLLGTWPNQDELRNPWYIRYFFRIDTGWCPRISFSGKTSTRWMILRFFLRHDPRFVKSVQV